MPRDRSFSFESAGGNGTDNNARYQDSPERSLTTSSPPQYFSHPTPHEPASPVSASRPVSHYSRNSSRYDTSFDAPRRSLVILNNEPPPPMPPPHRKSPTREAYRPESNVTAGMDNFGSQSQGRGLDRVARQVADPNQGESGIDVMQGVPPAGNQGYYGKDRDFQQQNSPYQLSRRPVSRHFDPGSSGSGLPLAASAATPGQATPYEFSTDAGSSRHSMRSVPQSYYAMGPIDSYDDSPYQRRAVHTNPAVGDADILPHNIIDDGDDGFMPEPKRKTMLNRERSREGLGKGGVAAGGAAAGAGTGVLGGILGRKEKNITSSGSYNPVSATDGPTSGGRSEWLSKQNKSSHKMRWMVGGAIIAVIIIAIVGGVVGGVLGSRNKSSGGSGSSGSSSQGSINNAADDLDANGDLNIDSPEIRSLMNNKNLHRVFPAMDYTPWGVQYPLCLTYPPSQNNVTRDMAVLSKLTKAVRLYGTDCNQTEMVLHAIDRLKLTDMKVWLGVWIDQNQTTNTRQLEQMYNILEKTTDHSIFEGVIIGNEALFRAGQDKSSSHTELVNILADANSNFTSLGYDLTISTSDLGDNWDAPLAAASYYVMSNVHPFFAGVSVEEAAGWTWSFWQNHDVPLTGSEERQIIAETGWPSGGGTDCGNEANVCAAGQEGAVASVDNLNKFMEDWVCQALDNGTNYFWFSAFDEAWKVDYNEPGKEWEDKWGLMDTARNLKNGLKIPDCGGKTLR